MSLVRSARHLTCRLATNLALAVTLAVGGCGALAAVDQYTVLPLAVPGGLSLTTSSWFGAESVSSNGAWGLLEVGTGGNGSSAFYRWSRAAGTVTTLGTGEAGFAFLNLRSINQAGTVVGSSENRDGSDNTTQSVPMVAGSGTVASRFGSSEGEFNAVIGNGDVLGAFHSGTPDYATYSSYRAGRWIGGSGVPEDLLASGAGSASTAGRPSVCQAASLTYAAGVVIDAGGVPQFWRKNLISGAITILPWPSTGSLTSAYQSLDSGVDVRGVTGGGEVVCEVGNDQSLALPARGFLVNASATAAVVIPLPSDDSVISRNVGRGYRLTKVDGLITIIGISSEWDGSTHENYRSYTWVPGTSPVSLKAQLMDADHAGTYVWDSSAAITSTGEILTAGRDPTQTGFSDPSQLRWLLLSPVQTVNATLDASTIAENAGTPLILTVSRTGLSASLDFPLTARLVLGGTAVPGIAYTVSGGTLSGSVLSVTISAGSTTASASIQPQADGGVSDTSLVVTPVSPTTSPESFLTTTAFVPGSWAGATITNTEVIVNPATTLGRSGSGTVSGAVVVTIDFQLPVTGFAEGEVTADLGTLGSLSGSGSHYTATWTPPASGTGAATISVGAGVALAEGTANGNQAASDLVIAYDTQAPAAPVFTSPASGATIGATVVVSGTVGEAGLNVWVGDGPTWQPAQVSGTGWSTTLTGLTGSVTSVKAAASDAAGNRSGITTLPVVVDADPPALTFDPPTSPTSQVVLVLTGTTETGALVAIRDGGSVLGGANVIGAAWSFTTGTLAEGNHDLVAIASDSLGNATSLTQAVVIDATAPVITIAGPPSPTNNSTPTFQGSIDSDAWIHLTDTGEGIGGSGPLVIDHAWSFTTNPLADGDHLVVVEAVDWAGNRGSATVSITVDTIAPAIAITPLPTTPTNNPLVGLVGTVSGASQVLILDGITSLGSATIAGGTWSFTTAALAEGSHTLIARASDAAGNNSQDSTGVEIDLTPPVLTFAVLPTPTRIPVQVLSGTTEAGAAVAISDGGSALGSAVVVGTAWSFTSGTLAGGNHDLVASASDAVGNATSLTRSVVVDTVAPAVTFTAPGSPTNLASVPLTGTVEVGATVTVVEGGTILGAASVSGGAWSFTAGAVAEGTHTLVAVATDAAGNSATSSSVALTVDRTIPTVTIASLASPTQVQVHALSGTVESGSLVTIRDGATSLGSAVVSGSAWSFTTGSLAEGSHTLAAVASDAAGNQAQATTTVMIDRTPPVVTLSASATTVATGGTVTLSAVWSDAGSGIASVSLTASSVTYASTGSVTAIRTVDSVARTIVLSGISGTGTISVTVLGGTATDQVGLTAGASAPLVVTVTSGSGGGSGAATDGGSSGGGCGSGGSIALVLCLALMMPGLVRLRRRR